LISSKTGEVASLSQEFDTHFAEIEYVPTAEIVMLEPDVEFDQCTLPVVQVAVKVKVFGEQTNKLVGGVTVGAVTAFIETFTATKSLLQPLLSQRTL
jgi:hypothetical protein